MLTEAQIREFDERGYVLGDRVLSDDQIERLRSELRMVMDGKSVRKPVLNRNLVDGSMDYGMSITERETVVQIVNIWMASEAFFKHAAHAEICADVARLCRTDTLRIWHDQVQYKPPKTGGVTRWHQDHPAWPIIQPPDLVSAWVALDDADVENGCMWMVPGSHKWGNHDKYITAGEDFKVLHTQPDLLPPQASINMLPLEVPKGHVGYHHCLTWHGSPHNRSSRKRRAIAVHYMPGHIRYEPTGTHPMEPYVQVDPHSVLEGDHFPVVYHKEQVQMNA